MVAIRSREKPISDIPAMNAPVATSVPLSAVPPEAWDAVAPGTRRSPMSLRLWVDCAARAYGVGDGARALVVGDPAAPRAVLPLVRLPGPAGRHFFAGNEGGGVSVACADDLAMAALARGVLRFGYPVNLGYVPTDSRLRHHLQGGRPGLAVVVSKPLATPLWPFIALDESWTDPARHLRKSTAASIRRRERQLRALGDLRLEYLTPNAREVGPVVDRALRVEAMGWKRARGIALAADTRQAAFFHAYTDALARRGRLHVTFLSLDGAPLAMSLGEIHDGTYWAYKTGYSPAFRRYGPGILMQYHLIRHCAERGLSRFDFQGRQDEFKRAWTDRAVAATSLRVYPLNLRGMAAMSQDIARHGTGRLRDRTDRARADGGRRDAGPDGKALT